MALSVFFLLNPLDLFSSSYQDPSASDSQFFLHEARRLADDGDITALFTTWGSLLPVLYGATALTLFGGSYIGILFLNSLIYSLSVLYGARLINISSGSYKLLPILGLMPLQGFYNSMLAKEPIYLFLVVFALYTIVDLINNRKKIAIVFIKLTTFFFVALILVIFRPTGAIILSVATFTYLIRQKGLKIAGIFVLSFSMMALVSTLIANYIDYSVPLFFIGKEGEISFSEQTDLSYERIGTRMSRIPEFIAPIFLPPASILASPILFPLWMISPLPTYMAFIESTGNLISGRLSFFDFSVIVRYLDAIMILLFLIRLVTKKLKIICLKNPLILFGFLQVLSIVIFQFIESGRHRYLPGYILALLVVYSFDNFKRKKLSEIKEIHIKKY
jgi:hypothetical protein